MRPRQWRASQITRLLILEALDSYRIIYSGFGEARKIYVTD
jgi:hypothetical protein